MSADNWTICPKCYADSNAAKEKQKLEAGAAYGKVDPAEYLRMIDAAAKPVYHEQTLREDYELGIDNEGFFSVSYRCSCQVCGFRFDFKQKKSTT